MTTVESALRRIVAGLARCGNAFALVGGLAISARAEPRFTRDADLVVSVSDDDAAEQVVRVLLVHGYVLVATVDDDVAGRLATARLMSPVAADEELAPAGSSPRPASSPRSPSDPSRSKSSTASSSPLPRSATYSR